MKKAMILAAGLGTRLRPLTNHLPKPLVPIANQALLVYHLKQLADIGVEEVMINVHHLPESIQKNLGSGEEMNLKLSYSLETPDILGTGGGLSKVADFFEGEDAFFFINGDILHNFDLRAAHEAHKLSKASATLLTRPHPLDGKTGWVGVDQNEVIQRVPDMPEETHLTKRMFTGLHVLTPEIFSHLPKKEFGCVLRTGYRAMLEQGAHIHSHFVGSSFWIDIGTPKSYLEANWAILEQQKQLTFQIAPNANIADDAKLGKRVIIGEGAVINERCKLENCVVWSNAQVPVGTELDGGVIFGDEILRIGQ